MNTPVGAFTIQALSTITLQVADLGRSLAFYRDALGLDFGSASQRSAQTQIGQVSLLLHVDFDPTLKDRPRGAGVDLHFSVADVDACFEALSKAGLQPEGAPEDHDWGREFAIKDPDGYEIEFIGPPP